MSDRVLFVDDEPDALAGYRRVLRNRFEVHAAAGPEEGLALARTQEFPVVVADMRMPVMDGVHFLTEIRRITPDSIRMMLTGHADTATAIDAVNQGSIFRFLTKPCSPELLTASLHAGIEQWRLVRAEKELLEKTLKGSVRVLIDVLELSNPVAFGCATRARRIVSHLGRSLNVQALWQIELAALLSQLGCITIPPEVLERHYADDALRAEEQAMIASHPSVGAELIANIPRLERIARMIQAQAGAIGAPPGDALFQEEHADALGAQLLRVALEFDRLLVAGVAPAAAVKRLGTTLQDIHPKVFASLSTYESHEVATRSLRQVAARDLTLNMEAVDEIRAKNGTLLVPRGRKITGPLLLRIRNFAAGVGVREPMLVREA